MKTFSCCCCNKKIQENYPYHKHNKKIYCGDCAFINNLIDKQELKEKYYFFIAEDMLGEPIIKDNEVIFVSKAFIKYQKTKLERRTSEYKKWRDSVYKRDNYTCQICGQVGGELNAHHIKHFSTHQDLRLDINNGITLCKKCHKEIHKKIARL